MLRSLTIKNYALIEDLAVEFGSGLNIITGETGAGKSIIIDALSLILGERAETDAIRKGAEKTIVEAIFPVAGNTSLKHLLQEHDIESTDELILRREISIKGQNRAFINDTPSTIALLKQAGDLLVDLHGQHEHQSLLRTETHIGMLDEYGGLEKLTGEFREAYNHARGVLKVLDDLMAKEQQLAERRALYEFQMKEIDALDPHAGEEAALESELKILENAEKLAQATEKLYQMMYEGENAVHDQLVNAHREIENLASIDTAFEEARKEIVSAAAIIDELAKFIRQYNERIEFNPARLEEIRNRLGNLTLLKKKYGGTLESLLEHRETVVREFMLAENFQEEIAKLRRQFDEARTAASEIAGRLSAKRREAAKNADRAIVQSLAELGIANSRFETRIEHRRAEKSDRAIVKEGKEWMETTASGIDVVEFHVSTNIGEDVKPLVKVASGGEISRIMLALKMILAISDRLPLLIFDEIDVGVSGRIAQAVGQSLKKLSKVHQVIAITHLPQIAGFADAHYVVEKSEANKRSTTRMRLLGADERVTEVAKLMSGAEVTERGRETARELMGLS